MLILDVAHSVIFDCVSPRMTNRERWRAAAVKASAQEIERLKEELAEQREANEEKNEALEDAEGNVDMLKDKLEQYKDVVELQPVELCCGTR